MKISLYYTAGKPTTLLTEELAIFPLLEGQLALSVHQKFLPRSTGTAVQDLKEKLLTVYTEEDRDLLIAANKRRTFTLIGNFSPLTLYCVTGRNHPETALAMAGFVPIYTLDRAASSLKPSKTKYRFYLEDFSQLDLEKRKKILSTLIGSIHRIANASCEIFCTSINDRDQELIDSFPILGRTFAQTDEEGVKWYSLPRTDQLTPQSLFLDEWPTPTKAAVPL